MAHVSECFRNLLVIYSVYLLYIYIYYPYLILTMSICIFQILAFIGIGQLIAHCQHMIIRLSQWVVCDSWADITRRCLSILSQLCIRCCFILYCFTMTNHNPMTLLLQMSLPGSWLCCPLPRLEKAGPGAVGPWWCKPQFSSVRDFQDTRKVGGPTRKIGLCMFTRR